VTTTQYSGTLLSVALTLPHSCATPNPPEELEHPRHCCVKQPCRKPAAERRAAALPAGDKAEEPAGSQHS